MNEWKEGMVNNIVDIMVTTNRTIRIAHLTVCIQLIQFNKNISVEWKLSGQKFCLADHICKTEFLYTGPLKFQDTKQKCNQRALTL